MSTSESGLKGESSDKSESHHDESNIAIDPRQWPNKLRRGTAIMMGLFAFLEAFASSMIAPSLPLIAEEFGSTSSVEQNVSTQIYRQNLNVGKNQLTPIAGSFIVSLAVRFWDSSAGARLGECWTQAHPDSLSRLFSGIHNCMRIRSEQRPTHCLQSPGGLWRLCTFSFGCCGSR